MLTLLCKRLTLPCKKETQKHPLDTVVNIKPERNHCVSVCLQQFSLRKGSDGSVLPMNIIETSLKNPSWSAGEK